MSEAVMITADRLQELRQAVTDNIAHGPNTRYAEGGELTYQRLMRVAKETAETAVTSAQGFEDSLKLDMIEKWVRTNRMDFATKLSEYLRAGKPIREAFDLVMKDGGKRVRK